jgi:hypothetical protein
MIIERVMTNVIIILTHVENVRQRYFDDIKARFPSSTLMLSAIIARPPLSGHGRRIVDVWNDDIRSIDDATVSDEYNP